jgi:energy-coupling factor transporter transmembrane protein EcfT
MSQSESRGRIKLSVFVLIQLLNVAFTDLFALLFLLLVIYFLFTGKRWAKWLYFSLVIAGGLFTLMQGIGLTLTSEDNQYLLFGKASLAIGLFFIGAGWYLATSKDVYHYLTYREQHLRFTR